MKRLFQAAVIATLLAPIGASAQDIVTGYTAYLAGDHETAVNEWRPLAEQGDATAQLLLGVMYDEGLGVPQDHAEAVRWFLLAAEQGEALAQNNLGDM